MATSAKLLKPTLYSFWFSSCSWRVRIALHYKDIEYNYETVDILHGKQFDKEYERVNPLLQVPTLKVGDDFITQSSSILNYLEEVYPTRSLLPKDPIVRAQVRSTAELISTGMQPFQNLATVKYLAAGMGDEGSMEMPRHFIKQGLKVLEGTIQNTAGSCCYGDDMTLADAYLVPQCFAAVNRFDISLPKYPTLMRIYEHLMTQPSVVDSQPSEMPDCPGKQ